MPFASSLSATALNSRRGRGRSETSLCPYLDLVVAEKTPKGVPDELGVAGVDPLPN